MPAMLSRLTRLGLIALLTAPVATVPAPLAAQSSPPALTCMARPGNTLGSPLFVAVIPLSEQQAMTEKGFSPQNCVVDPGELAAYRTKVCHLANDAPAEVQVQFEQQYNVSPRALCDMANTLVGA